MLLKVFVDSSFPAKVKPGMVMWVAVDDLPLGHRQRHGQRVEAGAGGGERRPEEEDAAEGQAGRHRLLPGLRQLLGLPLEVVLHLEELVLRLVGDLEHLAPLLLQLSVEFP